MAVYTNDLRLKEIATGDEAGTWGNSTNTNLQLIADAFGFGTEAITTNADTHTTTIADGSADAGRAIFLKYTGTLDSACTITIGPNTVSKLWFIENATSGSQNIIIKQGSGATVTIPAGDTKAIYSDGAGSGGAMVDAFASLNVVDLKVEDDLTVTDDLIVNGDIDLEGSIDVNGTANLDVVDIDGAVDMASTLQVDGAITSSAGATITTADNLTQLTLKSTDTDANVGPRMDFTRDSSSPAASDSLGQIRFMGEDAGDNSISYAHMTSFIVDPTDGSEDGKFEIDVRKAGTQRSRLLLDENETVFNQESQDLDFRVESDARTHGLFVDGGTSAVSIGVAPRSDIHSTWGQLFLGEKGSLISENLSSGGLFGMHVSDNLYVDSDTGAFAYITADEASLYTQEAGKHQFFGVASGSAGAAATTISRLEIDASGNVVFNEGSNDSDFRVESDSRSHMLFVDAGSNRIGVGSCTDPSTFDSRASTLVVQQSGDVGMALVSGDNSDCRIAFTIAADTGLANGAIRYDNNDDTFSVETAGTARFSIDSTGRALIGADSGDSFNADSMLRLQRTGDRVFIQLKTDADQDSGVLFGDVDDDVECSILYEPDKKGLTFTANNGNRRIDIGTSESVVNEDSESVDFRVEGNGEANLLFCDASADRVGIGTNSPSGVLHLRASIPQLYIQSDDGENPSIVFGDASDASRGQIKYTDGDEMQFLVNNLSQGLRIESTRKVVNTIGDSSGVGIQLNNVSSGDGSILKFFNASGSPADGDICGRIDFNGNDSVAAETTYALITGFSTDVTNGTEDGQINLSAMLNGTSRQRIKLDSDGAIFNEESTALDLRVESDSRTHMLFVDGANNFVGIGNNGRVFSSSELLSIDGNDPGIGINVSTAAEQAIGIIQSATSSTNFMIRFDKGTGAIGSITHNGSATAYNTSSDERLKENIKDADDAGELIDSIQVRQFDWKDNGRHQRYGMVAQELNIVAPEACAMGDGEEDIAAVDYSILVPMLLKEIQTLRARVAKLEGE